MKRFAGLMVFIFMAAACAAAPAQPSAETPRESSTPTYPCPVPTPEYLAVEPLPLRTSEDAVTFSVTISNGEAVTITSEFTSVTVSEGFNHIRVPLKTGKTQHFTVAARVRQIGGPNGCTYGGYTLTTTSDRNGLPLVVTQGEVSPVRVPEKRIAPETLGALQLINILPRTGAVFALIFLNDRELLTVGDQAAVWNVLDGSLKSAFPAYGAPLYARAADLDARRGRLALGSTAGDVRLIDLSSGAQTILPPMLENGGQDLSALAFSPDGEWLAAGSPAGQIYIWNTRQLTVLGTTPPAADTYQPVVALHWLDQTRLLAVYLNQIVIWELPSLKELERFPAPEAFLNFSGSDLSLDHTKLWLTAGNENLYAYLFASGSWETYLPGDDNAYTAGNTLALNPEELFALVADAFGGVRFWLLDPPRRLSAPVLPMKNITSVSFSPDGRLLAISAPTAGAVWILGIP